MDVPAVQTALELDFKTRWVDTSLIIWENTESPDPKLTTFWVRFSIQFGVPRYSEIGRRGFRYPGIVFVSVFTEKGIGSNRGTVLANAAALLYRGQVVSGCIFDVPQIMKIDRPDKDWAQTQMSAPFYFTEILP